MSRWPPEVSATRRGHSYGSTWHTFRCDACTPAAFKPAVRHRAQRPSAGKRIRLSPSSSKRLLCKICRISCISASGLLGAWLGWSKSALRAQSACVRFQLSSSAFFHAQYSAFAFAPALQQPQRRRGHGTCRRATGCAWLQALALKAGLAN